MPSGQGCLIARRMTSAKHQASVGGKLRQPDVGGDGGVSAAAGAAGRCGGRGGGRLYTDAGIEIPCQDDRPNGRRQPNLSAQLPEPPLR